MPNNGEVFVHLRAFSLNPDDPLLFPKLIEVCGNALLPDAHAQLKFHKIHNEDFCCRKLWHVLFVLLPVIPKRGWLSSDKGSNVFHLDGILRHRRKICGG